MANFVSNVLAKSISNIRLSFLAHGKKVSVNWSLYDNRGRRKYLTPIERWAFFDAALRIGGTAGTFCAVLTLSGARLSEVLALTPEQVDVSNCALIFETLKRRRRHVYRAVPVPRKLLDLLESVHSIQAARSNPAEVCKQLWPWSRTTGWRRVKKVMVIAGQSPPTSTPKALRHAFGAEAALNRVGLPLIKNWMGHAKLETTEIYTTLIGKEERRLARSTWKLAPPGFRG